MTPTSKHFPSVKNKKNSSKTELNFWGLGDGKKKRKEREKRFYQSLFLFFLICHFRSRDTRKEDER